jgi:hypothetical protein
MAHADPAAFTVTDEEIDACAELLTLHADTNDEVEMKQEDASPHVAAASDSSSSSSSRPHQYAQNYSEADLNACVKMMVDSNGKVGARAASSAYCREHAIHVPHSTIQSRYLKQASGELEADVLRAKAYLTPSQRKHFADWIVAFSRAHLCLNKELLNAKVMELAFSNGRTFSKPPGKHFWRDFFREVGLYLCFWLVIACLLFTQSHDFLVSCLCS